ncbi:MAG: RluA family pseudouridine synthase [Planctomycetota bacterium]|nr:RluA family pseudouridine synthase [Planctomycetota bacterium]
MIEILHRDPLFIVVNKPSGVLTISTFGVASIQTLLREQLAKGHSTDTQQFVEPPHRLDRGTTGALLIASNRKSLSNLSQQFLHRQIRKRYLVAIPNLVDWQSQNLKDDDTLEDWMRKIPDVAQAEVVAKESEGAKLGVLHYRTLYRNDIGRILDIEMQTGRMHQIRLQFASRGFPILGDSAYGSKIDWTPTLADSEVDDSVETCNCDRSHEQHTALHAAHLAFRHPKDASWVVVNAPVSQVWKDHFPDFDFSSIRPSLG